MLTVAIADALSDAMRVHFSEESRAHRSARDLWVATLTTLASKLSFASIFIVPSLVLDLSTAIAVNVALGLATLSAFSLHLARSRGEPAWKVIAEHLIVATAVIILAHEVGGG